MGSKFIMRKDHKRYSELTWRWRYQDMPIIQNITLKPKPREMTVFYLIFLTFEQ